MKHDKPNVLLFTTDQQRGDHIELARRESVGNPLIETPNVAAFINRGAYFPNAYTEIPSTTGARRCLHGGQSSHTCGLIGYASTEWHERNTLAQVLADNGYHCINVGWRNLHPRRKLYGFHIVIPHDLRHGDDDYMEWLERELGPQASEYGHGCDANGWLGRPWHLEERYHSTVWTTDTALDQLKRRDPTRPWFLWLSHMRPHSPYDPPQFFWDMYAGRKLPEIPVGDWAHVNDVGHVHADRTAWRGRLPDEANDRQRIGYLGTCTHLDYELGRFFEMAARHIPDADLQNTLVIFTSDHGDMMSDHHLHRKAYAYEGSARIPFVIQYPKGLDLPTGTFEQVVGLQDVMPTVLDAAGIDVPDSVTGRSVFRAIRGEPWREFFHGEHSPCYALETAVQYLTDGREKYLYFPVSGEEQFFDLGNDRQELHELSKDPAYAERVALWRNRLIELLGKRGDGFSDGKKLLTRHEWYGPEAEGR